MHIILRFELEQACSPATCRPTCPAAWNEKFERSFGLQPQTTQGCLQDIHWRWGGIGYFPTYTLGNLYAAQFMAKARTDLPGFDDAFLRGDFAGAGVAWRQHPPSRSASSTRPPDRAQPVYPPILTRWSPR